MISQSNDLIENINLEILYDIELQILKEIHNTLTKFTLLSTKLQHLDIHIITIVNNNFDIDTINYLTNFMLSVQNTIIEYDISDNSLLRIQNIFSKLSTTSNLLNTISTNNNIIQSSIKNLYNSLNIPQNSNIIPSPSNKFHTSTPSHISHTCKVPNI